MAHTLWVNLLINFPFLFFHQCYQIITSYNCWDFMMVKRFQSIRDCFNLIITSSLLHFISSSFIIIFCTICRVLGLFLVDHSIGLSSDWMTNQALTIPLICKMFYLSIYSFQPAIAFCYTLESFKPISFTIWFIYLYYNCVFSLWCWPALHSVLCMLLTKLLNFIA